MTATATAPATISASPATSTNPSTSPSANASGSANAAPSAHRFRTGLAVVLVAVLIVAAFILGRVGVSSAHHGPAIQPATVVRPHPRHCGIPGPPC